MPKIFYTERDIEDMAKRGEKTLVVTDGVVLTDLAYESARRLGVELTQPHDTPPGAPIRPYINKTEKPAGVQTGLSSSTRVDTIKQRVKAAVKQRLGSQVEDDVLDRIIDRVTNDLGLR